MFVRVREGGAEVSKAGRRQQGTREAVLYVYIYVLFYVMYVRRTPRSNAVFVCTGTYPIIDRAFAFLSC